VFVEDSTNLGSLFNVHQMFLGASESFVARVYRVGVYMDKISEDLPGKRKRKKYRLSAFGLAQIRKSVYANRPWEKSTGPRTKFGKMKSRGNRTVHGLYTDGFAGERHFLWQVIYELRDFEGKRRRRKKR
jgi:hypothetical protein